MGIFSRTEFHQSAPTTYGFPTGHVFAVNDPDEVLYEHLGHNAFILEARPVASPALKQVFTQAEFRELVLANKIDPRTALNGDARRRTAARNPDLESSRDLSDDERESLLFYARLARRIQEMYLAKATSKTDVALRKAIRRVMAELTFGFAGDDDVDAEDGSDRRGKTHKDRGKKTTKTEDTVRRIGARQIRTNFDVPSPTTVRVWINTLIEHDWDELSIRDHRKSRCGNRMPRITDPESLAIMAGWVRAYLDRNRPTAATLYKLMIGSVDTDEVNRSRVAQAKAPLGVLDLQTFAQANASRRELGDPPLTVPSRSTFERNVRKLDRFEVCATRHGIQEARRRFKIAGRREAALAAGERVAIDSWRLQLATMKMPGDVWAGLPNHLVATLGRIRLNVSVAICEATKVPLGVRLSVNPDADTVLRTLEMVCRDKSAIAREAGCRSTWHHACSPESVPTDSGSENIDSTVRWAVRDIGASNEIGPAKHPDARPWVERFFETIDVQFLQHFQGRTFSGIGDKGDYDPADVANVVVDVLRRALVRYLVDVYLNSPHAGLGGQTPNDAWVERTARFGIVPPPAAAVLRAVFGFADNRRIQNRGVRFLGLWYASEQLGRLRFEVGQADVRIRADLENLGAISVCKNVRGAAWFSVPCTTPIDGVTAHEWLATAADLRRRHADAARLRESTVLAALRDLRAIGLQSALEAGLGPSTMSRDDVLREEELHFRHFGIVTAKVRGSLLEGTDVQEDGTPLPLAEVNASPDETTNASVDRAGEDEEPEAPVVRRRGRLGADFLGED